MHAKRWIVIGEIALGLAGLAACGDDAPELTAEERATLAVKNQIATDLDALHAAAVDIQSAAPTPDADGWNATDDAAEVERMRSAWRRARIAYERVEGAIAVLFPDLDAATDERYDGFIAEEADENLFDGEGVTGVHAIERILWADEHPEHVVAFESALTGYQEARFPSTAAEARAFEEELCQRLIDDFARMRDDFRPLALDPAAAFRGVIGSMEEQLEKVALASTGEDESRYAQHTLADMRANLAGGRVVYDAFRPWLAQEQGESLDGSIVAGFGTIESAYTGISGDAIPAVPDGWNPDEPTAEHLATPYGQLFQLLTRECDLSESTSLVHHMADAANLLGIPALPE